MYEYQHEINIYLTPHSHLAFVRRGSFHFEMNESNIHMAASGNVRCGCLEH